jgi:N-acetyl-anhydromuramyl-L-alanine amidase AmpD
MKTHIVVHHSVTPNQDWYKVSKSINASHRERGFPVSSLGYYIGYHAIIDPDGYILQTRDYDEIGAHAGVGDWNKKSIGVCLIGNFEEKEPTNKQLHSLAAFIERQAKAYNIPRSNIKYHGELKKTACCGSKLIKKLPEVISVAYDGVLQKWEQDAKQWAQDHGLITNWDHLPCSKTQAVWFAEILRKYDKYLNLKYENKKNDDGEILV